MAASTQNQALSSVLFIYQWNPGHELEFIETVKAKRPKHLPLVLSRQEVSRMLRRSTFKEIEELQGFPDNRYIRYVSYIAAIRPAFSISAGC